MDSWTRVLEAEDGVLYFPDIHLFSAYFTMAARYPSLDYERVGRRES